ncbi:MAG: SEC-C metal-binding domain-containing protein, partial [Dehalococcoidia bacterium]|nr:SEC-C metal-binding domain-containing protein [Dehalococcoidia bacterium]
MISRVGRNEPCPCGSGRKYKKCCMLADQAAIDQTTPRLINRASEESAQLLLSHARATRGESFLEDAWRVAWLPDPRPFERASPFNALIIPWAIYLWDGGDEETVGPGSVAADFLATPMVQGISDRTRRFMEACQAEPLTFWQVQAVEPGAGMTLRDMATGVERFVHERSGSQNIAVWDLMFGQVVGVDGINTLSMSGPYILPSGRFREPVERFLADEVDAERLGDYGEFVLEFYFDCVDVLLHPQLP